MPFPSVPIHLPSDIDVKLHINHGVVGLSVNFVVDITNFFCVQHYYYQPFQHLKLYIDLSIFYRLTEIKACNFHVMVLSNHDEIYSVHVHGP